MFDSYKSPNSYKAFDSYKAPNFYKSPNSYKSVNAYKLINSFKSVNSYKLVNSYESENYKSQKLNSYKSFINFHKTPNFHLPLLLPSTARPFPPHTRLSFAGYNEEFYWLGGTDEEREDHWKWVDGTDIKMGFPLWFHCEGVVEPNSGSRANCLVTAKNAYYYLRDQNCINYYHPVCEFPAEGEGPTSTTAATTSPTGTTAPSPTTTAIFTTSERPSSTTPLA